jgi:hypothetical protein
VAADDPVEAPGYRDRPVVGTIATTPPLRSTTRTHRMASSLTVAALAADDPGL